MAKTDCGEGSVTCRCPAITGCGHLSSWHIVFERWTARCTVPGCKCECDTCNCMMGMDGEAETDEAVAAEVGIRLGGSDGK